MEEKHKKRISGAMALVFVLMICGLWGINFLKGDQTFSERENRVLTGKPKLELSTVLNGRFMKQYESYQADQFWGRDHWRELKTFAEECMGKKEAGGVYKGENGYLLEKIPELQQERVAENLSAIRKLSGTYKNAKFYMALIPNAANILSEKLPPFAVTENQSTQLKEVKEQLGKNIIWLNAEASLKTHKEEEIYYKTDHHWTSLGAYYVFREVLAPVLGFEKNLISLSPAVVTQEFNGTLSAKSGYESGYQEDIYVYLPEKKEPEPVEVVVNYVEEQKKTATMYDLEKLKERDKYGLFFGGNFAEIRIRTTAESKKKLLVFKDSYANCLIPLLTPYYREIVMIDPRYYYGEIGTLMEENKDSDVLFLYNATTFLTDHNIAGVLEESSGK